MFDAQRIIILAPHTDDGEFGCGGSISKFTGSNKEVFYIAFTLAEESIPEPFPKTILESEVKAATQVLGIKPCNLILYRHKVRNFSQDRQAILEELVSINREISPDLVFMPSLHDLHQDHSTIANEGLRAFKRATILGYEIPWNNMSFHTQCFIGISNHDLQVKIDALNCYTSQKSKFYASEDFIRSLAITRGTQVGKKYAEVFEVTRWIVE